MTESHISHGHGARNWLSPSAAKLRCWAKEEQYRLLFELNPAPMWICDENTFGFLDVNTAALKLYGWSRQEFLRMTAKDIRPPEERPRFLRVVREQRKSPATFVGEWTHLKRDGSLFDVAVSISSIRYADRAARLVLVNDITERKRAEAALRASEQRYRSLFENNLTGDFVAEPDGRILLCNAVFAAIFGFASVEEALHSNLAVLQADPDFWPALIQRLRKHKRLLRHECAVRRRDGRLLCVIETLVATFNDRGELAQVQGYVFDDTERKEAEQELKRLNATLERRVAERTEELADANKRLHAIMDTALVGVLTLNEHGRIETLNRAAARIFGYTPDEIVGHGVGQLLAAEDQVKDEEFLAHYKQPVDQRFMGAGREVLGRRKDGLTIFVGLTVSDFTHRGRRQFVAMVRDITARKRLERELLDISERERLRIGHDLHDGLGQQLHALSYLAALLGKGLQEEASPRAAEAGQLNKHLDEALEMTRSLAHGLQPVNSVPQGLMMALRELAERTRELYRIDCRFECRSPVLIHRHSAANHLYRIAQQAVNNALKHGKSTHVRIKLAATRQRIVLGVRDNGVGIPRQSKPGRGMGLHVMQYRADAISGSLTVQRHPQGGTEVICTANRTVLLPQEDNFK